MKRDLWITELSLYYSGVKRRTAHAIPTCVDERRKEIGRGKFGIVFLVAGETYIQQTQRVYSIDD
jgi:hypothetical protein